MNCVKLENQVTCVQNENTDEELHKEASQNMENNSIFTMQKHCNNNDDNTDHSTDKKQMTENKAIQRESNTHAKTTHKAVLQSTTECEDIQLTDDSKEQSRDTDVSRVVNCNIETEQLGEKPGACKERLLLTHGDSHVVVLDRTAGKDTEIENVICSQPVTKLNNGKEYIQPNGSHHSGTSHSRLEEVMMGPVLSRAHSIQDTLCHGPVTCLAIFTTFCCNLVLGIPAFVLAVLAQSAREHGMSRIYSRLSIALSVFGMLTGIIFYVTIIIFVMPR